jgi:hypothetical protein
VKNLLIITPVKDSIETAVKAISKVCESKGDFPYLVYNDRSLPENLAILETEVERGFQLINLEDILSTPSPNYRFTLIDARKKAIASEAHLLIVESDVFVQPGTISHLLKTVSEVENCGMVAAITTDESGQVNFPYLHIKKQLKGLIETKHRVSFCCTLLSNQLLNKIDFDQLSTSKDWFDVQISKESREMGFKNLIDTDHGVVHLPHSSRPWKKLKYENPVKYYLQKYLKKFDRI